MKSRDELEHHNNRILLKKIFVGCIPHGMTNEHLYEFFSVYGGIETAYIINDTKIEQVKNFGFVLFKTQQARDLVLK